MPAAITFSHYGNWSVLTPATVDLPVPGPGQVRIQVRAVAVNPIDAKIRSGAMAQVMPVEFPHVPGWDVAGVVDAVGEGATAKPGDEVFGVAAVGGYSEYAVLGSPVAKPAGLSWAEAAGIVTVGEAAFRVLKHLGLEKGQRLVILGAAGSVGTIATQLAVCSGLVVIGTAGRDDLGRVGDLGATAVPYGPGWAERVRAAAPEGIDAIFDTTGNGLLAEAVALTGDPAKVITIADPGAADHNVRFTGADPEDRFPEALPELAALLAKKELELPIWRTYPLEEAALAHRNLTEHRYHGKIILIP